MLLLIYGAWILGGFVAIAPAFIFPEAYDAAIYTVPQEPILRMSYAWEGGAIWGTQIDGWVAVVHGLVQTRSAWKVLKAERV